MFKFNNLIALAGLSLFCQMAAADLPYGDPNFVPTPTKPIGFCADGNSSYPGAIPTVVEWWDGKPGWGKVVTRGGTGNGSPPFDDSSYKEEEMRVLLDRVPKNILWKTPSPGWGDSQPVVVGDKIINTYWPHFVVCLDAKTGKELWRDELEWTSLPTYDPATSKVGATPDPVQARKMQTLYELGHAMRHLSYNLRDFEAQDPGPAEYPLVQKAVERLGQWRKILETDWPEAVPHLDWDIDLAKRFLAGEHAILGLGQKKNLEIRDYAKTIPQFGNGVFTKKGLVQYAEKVLKVTFYNAWPGWAAYQMASPASDGTSVAVRFSEGQVAVYDIASGKRRWAWRDARMNIAWIQQACSPRLGRGTVFLESFISGKKHDGDLMAIDVQTGTIRWIQSLGMWSGGYPSSTLLLLDLEDGKGGVLPTVFSTVGSVYRQSDGKLLCADLGRAGEHYVLHRGNLLCLKPHLDHTPSPTVLRRLRVISSDEVVAETVQANLSFTPFRNPTAMHGDRIIWSGGTIDLGTGQASPHSSVFHSGENHGATVMGNVNISHELNGNDQKFRARRDGMCLQTFQCTQIDTLSGPRAILSKASLLGGPEAPADLFFDKHLAGFDKMRQINPKKWCGRYGAHLGAFFGHRTGGVIPSGDKIYIQSQCFLYCIGLAVKGTPQDDPAIAIGIRTENDATKLHARLVDASAQYRFEALERLGVLKQPLSAPIVQTLAKLLIEDPYEEIRIGAFKTLNSCDPANEAGWKIMVDQEFSSCYATMVNYGKPGFHEQQDRRMRLPLTFRPLGASGPAILAARWPTAKENVLERQAFLAIATTLGWKVEPMFAFYLDFLKEPKGKKSGVDMGMLPAWLLAIDAASDPRAAEILPKAYPKDWILYPTFARHLPKDKLIAWIEPIAAESAHPSNRQRILDAWKNIGSEAIPSMERVAVPLAAESKNPLAPEFAKIISETIAKLKGK